MSSPGKCIRLSRFRRNPLRNSSFTHASASYHAAALLIPIDHGLTMGPLDGIRSVDEIATWINHPAIDGIIAHKGMVERLASRGLLKGIGVMVHLNGMAAFGMSPDRKELVTNVRAAQRLGADAVSVQVNFDGTNDAHNLRLLGAVADAAQQEGMPLLTMLYDKVVHANDKVRMIRMRHLIRLTIELGTDAVKLAPPAAAKMSEELPELLMDHAKDTDFYFAGGASCPDAELLNLAHYSARLGAAGLCVGRNVFGRDESQRNRILAELNRSLYLAEPFLDPALPSVVGDDHAVQFDAH